MNQNIGNNILKTHKIFNRLFKRKFNKLIKYFDEPHEKLYFNIILIIIFGIIYKILYIIDKKSFSTELSWFDSFYFSSITNFTLGYGDIIPKSIVAKTFVVMHSMIFWMVAIA